MSPTLLHEGVLSDTEAYDHVTRAVDPKGVHSERVAQEELSIRSMAFFVGKQYFWQDGIHLFEPDGTQSEDDVWYKANICKPLTQKAHARVLAVQGSFRVAPVSGSRFHRVAAKTSEKVLDHLRVATDYEAAKSEALLWAAITGSGYLKITWDPTLGEAQRWYHSPANRSEIVFPQPNEIQRYEQNGWFYDLPEGDIRVAPVSPFAFYWDWSARSGRIEDCRWVAQVTFVDIEDLIDMYGDKAREVSISDNHAYYGSSYYEEAVAFMTSRSTVFDFSLKASTTPQHKRGKRARVVEWWEKPGVTNNNLGRRIVIGGDTVLVNTDNKYRATGFPLPFVHFSWGRLPGRWWGVSLMEDLTEPQFHRNRARSVQIEHQDTFGQPSYFIPDDWNIPPSNLTGKSGGVYTYPRTSPGKIHTGPTPNLPREVAENASVCQQEMTFIASQSEPELKIPGSLRSGAGVDAVMREKNLGLTATQKWALRSDRRAGCVLLGQAKTFYTGRRVFRYMGDGGEYQVEAFRAADLSNDVRITGEPYSDETAFQKRQRILDTVQAGVFELQPELQVTVLKALEFGTDDEAIKRRLQGEEKQERELHEMVRDFEKYPIDMNTGEGGYPVEEWNPHEDHERVLRRR